MTNDYPAFPDPSQDTSPLRWPEHVLYRMPWAVLVLDEGRVLRLVNQEAARLLGSTEAALQDQPLEQVLPPGFPAELRQALGAATLTAESVGGEYYLPYCQRWVEMSTAPGEKQVLVFWQDITRAVEQRRQYQSMTDTIPDVILRWDTDHRLQYANAALVRRMGKRVSELLGCTLAEMGLPTSISAPYEAQLELVRRTEQPRDYYYQLPTPQGERHYHSRLTPEWQEGIVWQVLDIARDVTAVVQAQAEQTASTTLLRTAEQAAQTGSYEADLLTGTLRFSDGMFRLFGEEPGAFIPSGAFIDARSVPEDAAYVQQELDRAIASRSSYHYRRRIRSADGQQRTLEAHGNVVCDAAGEPVKLLGLVQDVTEREAAEAQIRRANRTIQRMLAGSPAAICLLEAQHDEATSRITDFIFRGVNQAAEILNQKTEAELVGHGLLELFPGVRETFFDDYVRVMETGQTWRGVRFYSSEHYVDRWFDVSAVKNGDGIIITFLDVTAHKQAEQRLAQANTWLTALLEGGQTIIAYYRAVRDEAGTLVDFTVDTVNTALLKVTQQFDQPGIRLSEVLPGYEQQPIGRYIREVMTTGVPQRHEVYYDFPNLRGWFDVAFTRLEDGFFTQAFEITQRKQVEQELSKNLTLLQQSEAVAQLGSWEYERATGAFRWSAGMYTLFGLTPGMEVTPQIYRELALEQDRAVADRLVRSLLEGVSSIEETLRIRVGGDEKTLHIKAKTLSDAQGPATRVLGVDLDVSEVHRLEAENLRMRLEQQQGLFDAVLKAQEAERRRIAESLHNGVGQLLYATKLRLDQLTPAAMVNEAAQAARREANQLLSEAIKQTRALSHELVPTVLEEFGLAAALGDVCRQLSSPTLHLHCQVVLDTEAARLSATLELALYRMAQELGQNVVKHARGATEASIELETMPGFVVLRAEDNGAGFGPEAARSTGLGLRSIRDRVQLLGGTVDVGSSDKFGTYVRIRIPLPAGARA